MGWSTLCQPYDKSAAVQNIAALAKAAGDVAAVREFQENAAKCGYQDLLVQDDASSSGIQAAKDLRPPMYDVDMDDYGH